MKEEILIFYDEECPFCNKYAKLLKLKEKYNIKFFEARKNLKEISSLCSKLDINDGFIVVFKNSCYQGVDALSFINKIIDKNTILGKLHIVFEKKSFFSKLLYKIIFYFRKIILFLLKRNSII